MKLDPEVYRNAAEILEEGKDTRFCCWALLFAEFPRHEGTLIKTKHLKAFARVFEPEIHQGIWWGIQDRESRIIALLLMADMVESENKTVRKSKP